MCRIMTFNTRIHPDDDGFIGRECPSCQQYFKVRPGTGLPTKMCHCPYCEHEGDISEFTTAAQKEWAKSLAVKEVVEPQLRKIEKSMKELERASSEFIKIRVTGGIPSLPVKSYREEEVETRILCDGCGLQFAVFGVFARCPDCTALNHRIVFAKSMEQCRKRLALADKVEDDETLSAILQDCVASSVSAFDALGKGLQRQAPGILANKRRNLFQDLDALSRCLEDSLGRRLDDIVGKGDNEFMCRMFQVRHVYQHNLGIVDEDAIAKSPGLRALKGRKYPLTKDETAAFVRVLSDAGFKVIECVATNHDAIKGRMSQTLNAKGGSDG